MSCKVFVHHKNLLFYFHSKLVINQIIPEDDGIYQCQAENDQGSVLAMARLIVVMSDNRPSAPRNVRADTVSSSAILLAWERPMYNSEKVIAYSVHYMKAEGEGFRCKKSAKVERTVVKMHKNTIKRIGFPQNEHLLCS